MHTLKPPPHWMILIDEWAQYLFARKFSKATVYQRTYQIKRFAVAHSGLEAEEVTPAHLVRWIATPSWKAATARNAQTSLRTFFRWMTSTGYLVSDPAMQLEPIRTPVGHPRPAGELAIRYALKTASPRVQLMIRLAAIQGLRVSEIARIHRRDIIDDLLGHSLMVHGKGNKIRLVPLDPDLANELVQRADTYIFPGNDNGHLSAAYVSKLISRALPKGITAHMLRHRAAGRVYIGSGYDLRATQTFLGHSSPSTTQIYTPAVPEQIRRGLEAAAIA